MKQVKRKWQLAAGAAVLVILLIVFTRSDRGGDDDSAGPAGGAVPNGFKKSLSALIPSARAKAFAAVQQIAATDKIVTGTWAELLEQPPIPLSGGGTARIGVEARSAVAGNGVLIYCLVEGNTDGTRLSIERIGPLGFRVRRPGQQIEMAEEMTQSISASHEDVDCLLFTRMISVSELGVYQIQLFAADEDEIPALEIPVTGTAGNAHPWFSFSPMDWKDGKESDATHRAVIAFDGLRAALPRHEGMEPIRLWNKTEANPGARLPKLVPDAPDPGLLLERTTSGFGLESEHAMVTSADGAQLLARWWVNGEPFSPLPGTTAPARHQWVDEYLRETTRLEVDLDFDPVILGAQPGDQIGMQILHVPSGWIDADPLERDQRLRALAETDAPMLPRLSNRIEFVAAESK